MIVILIISLLAILKAIRDTLDHHFDVSIFRKLPRKYFDPNVIHKTAPKIFNYPLDAWHILNSIELGLWLFMVPIYLNTPNLFGPWIFPFVGIGVHILVFNLFYNKIFYRKNLQS